MKCYASVSRDPDVIQFFNYFPGPGDADALWQGWQEALPWFFETGEMRSSCATRSRNRRNGWPDHDQKLGEWVAQDVNGIEHHCPLRIDNARQSQRCAKSAQFLLKG